MSRMSAAGSHRSLRTLSSSAAMSCFSGASCGDGMGKFGSISNLGFFPTIVTPLSHNNDFTMSLTSDSVLLDASAIALVASKALIGYEGPSLRQACWYRCLLQPRALANEVLVVIPSLSLSCSRKHF